MPNKFHRIALLRAAKLFDLALVTVAFVCAFAVSTGSSTWPSFAEVLLVRIRVVNIFIFAGYLTFCSAIFSSCGFYLSHRLSSWTRRAREVLVATTLITGVLLVLPLGMAFVRVEFLVVFWLLTVIALAIGRAVGAASLYFARVHGRNLRNLVVVGEGKSATMLADRIEKESSLGYRVVRVIKAEEG